MEEYNGALFCIARFTHVEVGTTETYLFAELVTVDNARSYGLHYNPPCPLSFGTTHYVRRSYRIRYQKVHTPVITGEMESVARTQRLEMSGSPPPRALWGYQLTRLLNSPPSSAAIAAGRPWFLFLGIIIHSRAPIRDVTDQEIGARS